MNPGDVVILGKKVWRIKGVYIGPTGQPTVVGLESLTSKKPATGTGIIAEMFVPIELIEALDDVGTVIYKL